MDKLKQGVITLLPKPDKDHFLLENWRPITLLNVDYKILSLIVARRLKKGLSQIINETQTGFMANRHISCNMRLILDLIDYSEYVESDAVILSLDFYKAFDTVEHQFLFRSLQTFGFGENVISGVKMLHKNISSCVLLYPNTPQSFSVYRSVRQGCPCSPVLFLIVVEMLSIHIFHCNDLQGLRILEREINISQLADDTVLFLKDKQLIENSIKEIHSFSLASGLRLNVSKCESLCLYNTDETLMCDIPVKTSIKYLGIHISKDLKERQEKPKIQKTKNIFNMWLQRDLSMLGRVLLSKADGISRFIYPTQSLFIHQSLCKQISNILTHFIWKNKCHRLKKEILAAPRNAGGMEIIDFMDVNNTFRMKWIK